MLILKILALWLAFSIVLTPMLVPRLARRLRKHEDWFNAPASSHRPSSVTPQVRMLRKGT